MFSEQLGNYLRLQFSLTEVLVTVTEMTETQGSIIFLRQGDISHQDWVSSLPTARAGRAGAKSNK